MTTAGENDHKAMENIAAIGGPNSLEQAGNGAVGPDGIFPASPVTCMPPGLSGQAIMHEDPQWAGCLNHTRWPNQDTGSESEAPSGSSTMGHLWKVRAHVTAMQHGACLRRT